MVFLLSSLQRDGCRNPRVVAEGRVAVCVYRFWLLSQKCVNLISNRAQHRSRRTLSVPFIPSTSRRRGRILHPLLNLLIKTHVCGDERQLSPGANRLHIFESIRNGSNYVNQFNIRVYSRLTWDATRGAASTRRSSVQYPLFTISSSQLGADLISPGHPRRDFQKVDH